MADQSEISILKFEIWNLFLRTKIISKADF